jgi:hypothetical protein
MPAPLPGTGLIRKQKVTFRMERPPTTTNFEVIITPEYPPEDPRRNLATPKGGPGLYRYRAVLGIPGRGEVLSELDFESLLTQGDSLLVAPKGNSIKVDLLGPTPSLQIVFEVNGAGHLSSAAFAFMAQDFDEARRRGHDVLMPMLSMLAFQSDTAVLVVAVEIVEESTGTTAVRSRLLGAERSLRIGESEPSSPALARILAAYREGNNATSVLVRAIYYWQVFEGVQNLRNKRISDARATGQKPAREPSEKFPDEFDKLGYWKFDEEAFQPYLGRKFTWVADVLRKTVRNAAAHLDPHGDALVADCYDDIQNAGLAVPVLHYMARVMLETELKHGEQRNM